MTTVSAAKKLRVAVLDDYQGVAATFGHWTRLADQVEVQTFRDHISNRDHLKDRLHDFEIIVAMRERTSFDSELIAGLSNLRLLVTTGSRNVAIDVGACSRHGVIVCGTRILAHGTAELTWALILAAARHLPEEMTNVRSQRWMSTIGTDLHGARLGLVGLGQQGSQVARIGLAFGMNVVAWSEHLTPERCSDVGVSFVPKEELLSSSNFVSIHLVLSERTRGLIGESEVSMMNQTTWLVNTSRGPICDETALISACRDRRIAGVCLDVFSDEPLPLDHPFRTLPNVLATPHIGYVTQNGYELFFTDIVDDIQRWIDGSPVRVITE